jgi:hypothetical protein
MKTNIKKYIGLVLLIVVGYSCSDNFLEEKKAFGLYDESFYQSAERVNAYVGGLYNRYFVTYTNPQATMVGAFNTDRFRLTEEIGGIVDLTNPTKSFDSADDALAFTGYYGAKLQDKVKNEPYDRIRDCNTMIENIDSKGANLDKIFRDNVKGQMYYLRAIQYFDLMRVYGGVPIVTTVEDASALDLSIRHPRATVTEVVAQIVKDLDMAASLLPGKWDAANYGRFTKGAALAQKSRVLLTYASPLFNKNWDTATDRWEEALKAGLAAETQLTIDGYGLYGASAKDWENMFLIDNVFCKEAINVQILSNNTALVGYVNNSWEKSIRLASQGGSGNLMAPKEMIDLFPMANGSKPTTANGYDEFLFFKNRDPRFYRTFSFSGNKWAYKENLKPVAWAYRWVDTANKAYYSDLNQVGSPAFVRKLSNTAATNVSNFQFSGTDIFEYRYAELLLNIAECYAAKGDVTNTVAYLGKVRARVGIVATNNYGIGTLADKYAAISACLYERRVELAYEGKRFWDVQRWMLYSDVAPSGIANNTCAKLGLTPINGTQRTGNFLQYKTAVPVATGATDPLLASRAAISVDPDAADFGAQITALSNFYTANFILTPVIMDNVNSLPVKIDFKPNYYLFGLQTTVLSQNTWLLQTVGWKDRSGSVGTFNYQD